LLVKGLLMAIVVRPADLEKDRGLLIDTFSRFLTPLSDNRRFDWLYLGNPHGRARAWLATDGSERVIGACAAFPRRFYFGDGRIAGVVLGDFCIAPEYRSLGPALQLQRACLESIGSGEFTFGYDFPSSGMLAIYKRLGIEPQQQIVRLAKPLRVNRKVAQKVKSRALAAGLSSVGNLALRLKEPSLSAKGAASISLHEGECGEEFTKLAERVSKSYGVCIERSAEYLNWRFLRHPFRRHEVFTACREEELIAYLVLAENGEDASIVTLFGEDEKVLRDLIACVVATLRKRGIMTVSAPITGSHPWARMFEAMGFRRREACPLVLIGCQGGQGASDRSTWLFMDGDRDS
jgi:hypothetical protein